MLSLKLNPFVFDEIINNDSAYNLISPNSGNSCNYIFDSSFGIDVSFKNGFSILHLNSRSFNRNCDSIDAFLSDIDFNFSVFSRVDKQRNEPGRWKSRIVAIFLLFLTLLHVLT